ncbi:MAG: DNA polymerase III subunit beta [Puniceicoccales bacterium]|jgi:DNA polymerase-3 subunit beta|nr:DNA polymerase III subunit beta [Puniceicoccales bacterium]
MKIIVNRERFSGGLQQLTNIVLLRPALAILGGILIEVADDHLTMTTTNGDCSICCTVAASVVGGGKIVVNVRKLASIVRALSCHDVEIEFSSSGGKQLKISGGGSVFHLPTIAADEFPSIPAMDIAAAIRLNPSLLLSLIRRISYAQSTDEHRQILNGVYFSFANGRLTLVATDGRRLALTHQEVSDGEGKFIVPGCAISELERLLSGGKEVAIAFNARQASFYVDYGSDATSLKPVGVHMICKVIEGTFPNYEQVIPATTESRIQISRELFCEAIQRVALVAGGMNPCIRLRFSENLLELSASSTEYGEAYERMALRYGAEQATEISFNPRYLAEPLRSLDVDEIAFEFRDQWNASVIRHCDNFLCVVMPLRVG